MGGVVSAGVDNDELVDKLKEADYIRSVSVEKVFRLVDRGYYLTKDNENVAYRDNAWRRGNLHISAPCIYAQVMEGLQLGPGMSFLNIGSGTGYLSTMAGLLIGPNGVNHGIELHSDVVEYARERLSWFIVNTGSVDVASFCEPQFAQGNALCLIEDTQLYDRVYCGASCPSSHEDYMKNLVKVDGVLIMPRNDKLLKITRTSKTTWTTESLLPVSFSSLIMPVHTFPPDSVELPSVNIISLQELTREVIRCNFRSRIEMENQDLKDAFVHTLPSQPIKDRRQGCRVSKTFPHIPISDTEYDTDGSEGPYNERDTIYAAQRLQANQLSAFLELARSLAMNRSATEGERNETRRRGVDEEENRSNQSENEEMLVDDEDEDLYEMIERATHNESERRSSDEENQSSENEASAKPQEEEKEEEGEGKPESTAIMVMNENGMENQMALDTLESAGEKVITEVVRNSNETDSAPPVSNPQTEDEEMVEVPVDEVSQGPSNGKKGPKKDKKKKREKFDSGIVEDMDPAGNFDDSSSCSFHSRSSSSDSSEVEGFAACKVHLHDPDGADCNCSGNCIRNGDRRRWWKKKREMNRRKRRTMKYEKESKTDSKAPINKFSQLMREKIEELPLPSPIKVYLNYNRPL